MFIYFCTFFFLHACQSILVYSWARILSLTTSVLKQCSIYNCSFVLNHWASLFMDTCLGNGVIKLKRVPWYLPACGWALSATQEGAGCRSNRKFLYNCHLTYVSHENKQSCRAPFAVCSALSHCQQPVLLCSHDGGDKFIPKEHSAQTCPLTTYPLLRSVSKQTAGSHTLKATIWQRLLETGRNYW